MEIASLFGAESLKEISKSFGIDNTDQALHDRLSKIQELGSGLVYRGLRKDMSRVLRASFHHQYRETRVCNAS